MGAKRKINDPEKNQEAQIEQGLALPEIAVGTLHSVIVGGLHARHSGPCAELVLLLPLSICGCGVIASFHSCFNTVLEGDLDHR